MKPPLLVLAIQYHDADRDRAIELARFIAELEPTYRTDVEIVFVRRFDAQPLPQEVYDAVAKKFYLSGYQTKTPWTGWPAGPNAQAIDFLRYILPIWDGVLGVLMLEPDCAPLARDWLKRIINSWMIALLDNCWVMGSWRDSGGEHGHINGCCVVRPDFYALANLSACGPDLAWDCYHTPYTRKNWCRSGLFLNKFRSTNATEEILRTPEIGGVPPVICHGYSDGSSMAIARRWLK